ncbi:MAG TPA: orotate phosphoribosyltransferase [Thermoplasmata archaeon]|nr:orotate phosphoribosyltransferase [Thermoplasmata archaeon]
MELHGLCSICGKAGKMYTCSICGRNFCSEHYDLTLGICISCKMKPGGKHF